MRDNPVTVQSSVGQRRAMLTQTCLWGNQRNSNKLNTFPLVSLYSSHLNSIQFLWMDMGVRFSQIPVLKVWLGRNSDPME